MQILRLPGKAVAVARRHKDCVILCKLIFFAVNKCRTHSSQYNDKFIKIMGKKEYAQANKEWLVEKAKEEGVMELPKGIYYKVLNQGNNDGNHPSVRSIITAHYTGKTINGKKFDSSRGGTPLACRLCELIEGWIIAMQKMCIGDKWEVYIPAEMGYGKFSQPGIPGNSTLIFEIELLGIA